MNNILYWWCGLAPVIRINSSIAAALILPVLYFVCKRLQRRGIWWIMLICVTVTLILGLTAWIASVLYNSQPIIDWVNANPYGSTLSWVDAIIATFTNTVLILVHGYTLSHCFKKKCG